MKKSDIKNMIKEELKKTLKEESQNRYVATIQFYVWAPSEANAKHEAEQVMQTIEHKYDNSPQITGLVPQQFGKMGVGENITEATKDEKLYELVSDLFKLFGDMKTVSEDFYEKLEADKGPLEILKTFVDKKSRSVLLRYFTLQKKLNNISKEELLPHIERWMEENEDAAHDLYSGQAATDLLKTL